MLENGDPSMLSAGFRMLWGLFVVLGIILIIYGLLRKRLSFIQSNDKSKIKIIEVRHIMPKKAVCLIDVKGQEFLIGLGNENITLLASIQNSEESSFETTLDSATKQHEQQLP
ncbi:MAG: FliO/MopB family protein [Desulfocapsa sp.]|nr:FliO/MopB family protein [Desulfocapsa sp.]